MQEGKINWWKEKRFQYNKALLIVGGIVVLGITLTFLMVTQSFIGVIFVAPTVLFFYLLYVGFLNLVLIIIETIDRSITNPVSIETKEQFFKYFYWLSLLLPIIYLIFTSVVTYQAGYNIFQF